MEKKSKSVMLNFRVPAEVAALWKESAATHGLNLSDWIRVQLDPKQVTHIAPPKKRRSASRIKADPHLLRQLGWIGNNLNQLARQANKSGIDGITLLTSLASIQHAITKLSGGNDAD